MVRLITRVSNSRGGLGKDNHLKLYRVFLMSHITYVAAAHGWHGYKMEILGVLMRKSIKKVIRIPMAAIAENLLGHPVYLIGGGPPPAPMSVFSALVGSVAAHMTTRIPNTDDSDGALYLPPIESEPVVRLLPPMVTGEQDSLFDSFGTVHTLARVYNPMYESVHEVHAGESCQGIPPAQDQVAQVARQVSRPSTSYRGITPTPEENASVPEENAEAPGGRAGQLRGRMVFLQQALGEEPDVRMTLLREEHAMRLKLIQDDHIDLLKKREEKPKLKMEILQVQKKTHQMRQDNLPLQQWAE
ncbi:uncharacterized protein LOC119454245 [Dermacentor silvarum]|uniref:uncharacterized protein LOC119454245 n=1 Tax=Dermacentor silvarum TaxID=543639 RepID=UPI0021006C7B|nr:uncharacterized protein LOC119454245 [Dermacentor silvarum]